ncbi:MAG: DUF1289 domain-containing protein [Bacteroidales bacterium]
MNYGTRKIKSPCIDVCVTREGYCIGCHRSMEEMAGWPTYTEEQKKQVLENIKKRRPSQDYYGGPV